MLIVLIGLGTLASCNDYETYADKKEKERNAVSSFISQHGIKVIDENRFHEQGNVTDTTQNQYVYLNNTGVYMQIVRPGCGTPLQDGENASLKIRFLEISILDNSITTTNIYDSYDPDAMSISRTGSNYTASFTSGIMYSSYGASVPSGWLVPFNYIKLDVPTSPEDDDIARVRLIVPHTQGHSVSSGNVYPYYYDITYQR